jgi:hypothetical protein
MLNRLKKLISTVSIMALVVTAEFDVKSIQSTSTLSSASLHRLKKKTTVICALCGLEGINMSRCGKCKRVYYCTADHQRRHWPKHKV